MTQHFGVPGIGGGLGKCSYCGETFLIEIIMRKTVSTFTLGPNTDSLIVCYAHKKCHKKMIEDHGPDAKEIDLSLLPDESPLKKEIERIQNESTS